MQQISNRISQHVLSVNGKKYDHIIDYEIPIKALPSPPQPFYGPFSGTRQVSRCQKRTSGLHDARED